MARKPRRPTTTENGGWTSLTPERQAKIVENILRGAHIKVAARAAGIDEHTLNRWERMGTDTIETDDVTGDIRIVPAPEPYRSFRSAIEDAEAALELDLVDQYRSVSRQAAFGNASHLAGFLARRFRPRWDIKQTLELSGPAGGPVEVKGGDVDSQIGAFLGALARSGHVVLPAGADSVPADDGEPDE